MQGVRCSSGRRKHAENLRKIKFSGFFFPTAFIFFYHGKRGTAPVQYRTQRRTLVAESKNRTSTEDGYLTGKLLLAMPSMGDPRFHRAVIFMCSHDETGAMGLVINHRLPGIAFHELIGQLDIRSDIVIDMKKFDLPVMNGGPVESARGFLLHTPDFQREETVLIDGRYGITGTVEAVREIVTGKGPDNLLFILGYAGWSAGQLDWEIQQNAWLVTEADPAIIFDKNLDTKWTKAVGQLGFDPGMLSGEAGNA
ncbi:MAG: YqgE/AlgH family protein [Alphaproteobacteria bacterium]|nr:YqgE/AlgH family protein [Alphaproteobacteria bacterium]